MGKIFRLLLLVILGAGAWLGFALYSPTGPSSQVLVQLRPGSSVRRIASDLQAAGIIRSAPAFLLLHYGQGRRSLKAGEYAFDHPDNAFAVYDRLARGDIYFHTVVVPEGFNMFDIATAVEGAGLGKSSDFLKLAHSQTALIADFDPAATSLEGYLFPDTYRFTRTQSMPELVGAMVKRFRQETRAIGLGGDVPRIVTLASIVEKETADPAERPIVAGVFTNRLGKNMLLGTDPSVIYAALLAGRYTGVIHQSDLQFDSPYNTYKYSGLPPGPISNPGRASLLAALRPASTDFYYFVSDNHGHHRFARTIDEHAHNVIAYRRELATQPTQ